MAVRIGEQRNGAQRGAVLLIELAGRVDEAHRGFATIDDCDSLELLFINTYSHDADRIELRLETAFCRRYRDLQCFQRLGVETVRQLPRCDTRRGCR